MQDVNKSNLSLLIDSGEFFLFKQLVGEELLKLEQRLNHPQLSEHVQTRLLGEVSAFNRALQLPELRLNEMYKQEKYKD